MKRSLFNFLVALFPVLFAPFIHSQAAPPDRELWRPRFHFTPERNWINDPNGMVFFEGEYHLFYQHNPFGDKWGHMSWGHAVSRDLLRWEHLPLALAEENGVMIFSGSAVVDWKNTSGLGKDRHPPLIAIYTGHYTEKPLQNQHIAYSNDRGRTWTKYSGNPVLDIGEKDFRDPKVFWHEPTQRWVMVVAWPLPRRVRFYASKNLKEWTHLSDFGPAGASNAIWECPDLFPLVSGGKRKKKWVLIVNTSGAPAGGSGCQYFVGDFDGTRFVLDAAAQKAEPDSDKPAKPATDGALWADYGPDFYAAVSWSDIPARDGRRLWLGWMSNWTYANEVPTSPWRNAMTLPRELALRNTSEGLRLTQRPVRELQAVRRKHHRLTKKTLAEANRWLKQRGDFGESFEVLAELEVPAATDNFGLILRFGTNAQVRITCDPGLRRISLDRSKSGRTDFHPTFIRAIEAPIEIRDQGLQLRFMVDASSIELFCQQGEVCLSALIFPPKGSRQLELFSDQSEESLACKLLEVWRLDTSILSPK